MKANVANDYRVPDDIWGRWSNRARKLFNDVYPHMLKNQWAFMHPKQEPMTRAHWKTVAWNAAWTAADAVGGLVAEIVFNSDGTERKLRR